MKRILACCIFMITLVAGLYAQNEESCFVLIPTTAGEAFSAIVAKALPI